MVSVEKRPKPCNTRFLNFVVYPWVLVMQENYHQTVREETIELSLTQQEMAAIRDLASKKELSKESVIRQAIRLYQMVDVRLSRGEKIIFEDEHRKKTDFVAAMTEV